MNDESSCAKLKGVSMVPASAPAKAATRGASRATQSACASSAPVAGGAAPRL